MLILSGLILCSHEKLKFVTFWPVKTKSITDVVQYLCSSYGLYIILEIKMSLFDININLVLHHPDGVVCRKHMVIGDITPQDKFQTRASR